MGWAGLYFVRGAVEVGRRRRRRTGGLRPIDPAVTRRGGALAASVGGGLPDGARSRAPSGGNRRRPRASSRRRLPRVRPRRPQGEGCRPQGEGLRPITPAVTRRGDAVIGGFGPGGGEGGGAGEEML